jgi:hypothetical protein
LVNEGQRTTKKKMTIIEITLWIKAFAGLVTAVVALVAALEKLVKAFRHRRRSTMGIRNVVPPRRKLRQLRQKPIGNGGDRRSQIGLHLALVSKKARETAPYGGGHGGRVDVAGTQPVRRESLRRKETDYAWRITLTR